jgi:coenzyme F420-0:L-glutamate ligase/coenzyme F420-1:gamma-L-glutamate ligase
MIEIRPLSGIGEIAGGCDLAAELADAAARTGLLPCAQDILVVTQKIVSKAEGRLVDLRRIEPSPEAQRLAGVTSKDPRLVELVLRESTDVLRAAPNVLITRHRSGVVLANAGIDRSNLGSADGDSALLLPEDADQSARRLHEALAARWGSAPGVIVSDSFGRPWRMGVVNVAIGAWALPALIDRRGQRDRDGRPLEVTQIAFADLVASAAGLAMGEAAEGVPAALVRGLAPEGSACAAAALVRPLEEDLFR